MSQPLSDKELAAELNSSALTQASKRFEAQRCRHAHIQPWHDAYKCFRCGELVYAVKSYMQRGPQS